MKITTLLIALLIQSITGEDFCGKWDAYKDEKCYGVLVDHGLQNFANAKALCSQMNSSLVQITSAEEQAFLTDMVFNKHKVVDDAWIGVVKSGKSFRWDLDQSDVSYTNWAKDDPSNATGEDCVQMLSKLTNQEGKWDNRECTKENMVICQKYQVWTETVIQQLLLKERKQLKTLIDQINDQSTQINSLKTQILSTIPVGFTYVQLPKEKAPGDIWPAMKWSNVSADYAGVFFRVQGAGSGKWGEIQPEDNPRLTKVAMSTAAGYVDAGVAIPKGGVGKIKTGVTGGPWYFQFEVSNTEVRPKNMAVWVWRRTG